MNPFEEEDDDDEYNDNDEYVTQFEDWFYYYQELIHPDLKQNNEPSPVLNAFYSGQYARLMSVITPAARQITYRQYPVLETESRTQIRKWIDHQIDQIGCCFLIHLFGLLHDERIQTNLREKYPEFEDWIVRYARPYDHFESLYELFKEMPHLTEAQKQHMLDEHAKEINWKEVRKSEFRTMLQDIILEHYPATENLSADGWIVYAYLINWEFADYRFNLEYISEFIQCGLTEEDLKLSGKEIHDKITRFYQEKYANRSVVNNEVDDDDDDA